MVTVPASPSTSMIAPSGMRSVASVTDTTHGMPSSRLTMMAWLSARADVTTTPPAGDEQRRPRRVGHRRDQDVALLERAGSDGSSTTRARPRVTPGSRACRRARRPRAATRRRLSPRFGHSVFGRRPAVDDERRLERSQPVVVAPRGDGARTSSSSPGDERFELVRRTACRCRGVGRSRLAPRRDVRAPSSAMRTSWMHPDDVGLRPLAPGDERGRRASAALNCPSVSGSPAELAAISAAECEPFGSRRSRWCRSAPRRRPARRMRSTAASTRSGLVSHVVRRRCPTRSGRVNRTRRGTRRSDCQERRRRRHRSVGRAAAREPVDAGVEAASPARRWRRPCRDSVPHRRRRRGRVDAAEAGEQAASSPSGRRPRRRPRRARRADRRCARLVDVLVEQTREQRSQRDAPAPAVRRRTASPGRAGCARTSRASDAVGFELVLVLVAHHPAEPAGHDLGRGGFSCHGSATYGGMSGCPPK